jgi:hypothetical protein
MAAERGPLYAAVADFRIETRNASPASSARRVAEWLRRAIPCARTGAGVRA